MKRYKHTWFNGMLEDPKGLYCKIDDHLGEWIDLHNKLCEEEFTSFILKWLLSLSILGNLGQIIYHLNT